MYAPLHHTIVTAPLSIGFLGTSHHTIPRHTSPHHTTRCAAHRTGSGDSPRCPGPTGHPSGRPYSPSSAAGGRGRRSRGRPNHSRAGCRYGVVRCSVVLYMPCVVWYGVACCALPRRGVRAQWAELLCAVPRERGAGGMWCGAVGEWRCELGVPCFVLNTRARVLV